MDNDRGKVSLCMQLTLKYFRKVYFPSIKQTANEQANWGQTVNSWIWGKVCSLGFYLTILILAILLYT